jgi:nitrite reductase/ring-hydroxylating ferredoxin subunit
VADLVTVARVSDIGDGEMRAFDVRGVRIAVAKVDRRFLAFDDTCTHWACSLADGDLEGARVTCPCHGSQFDVSTGALLHPPAVRPVRTYRVRVVGDELQVEV